MQPHDVVIIRFTSDVSVYPGNLLSALTEDIYNDYNPADSRCGYSVFPESPKPALSKRYWTQSIKELSSF